MKTIFFKRKDNHYNPLSNICIVISIFKLLLSTNFPLLYSKTHDGTVTVYTGTSFHYRKTYQQHTSDMASTGVFGACAVLLISNALETGTG